NDPQVNQPALMTIQSSNNAVHSPTAWKTKGDDYNRNPVGTGPYILKSWTAGDRIVLEKNPDYWNKGKPYLDRIVLKPLPDAQSRSDSLQQGEAAVIWDDEYDADNIQKAQKDSKLVVNAYTGSGAQVYAMNTKASPLDDVRVRQALVMALDRKKMSQAITNGLAKPASNPYGNGSWVKCKDDGALPEDPEKAKALLKDYGKPVDFKMIVTATPRGRVVGQVLQQLWKRVGANMEIEQVDQATIVPRAFMRQFQLTPWRIVDLADPDPQMYANFRTGSPVALANYSNPELDKLLDHARVTADPEKRTEDYCAISRIINKEAIWFWTFQNTYYAIATSKLKGLPKIYHGVIDVSDVWLECSSMLFCVALKFLYLVPVLIAVSLLTFLIASLLPGDLATTILADQATPENVAALRHDMGLDQPIWVRYFGWLGHVLQGDFGRSFRTGQTVLQAVSERLPVSFELMIL